MALQLARHGQPGRGADNMNEAQGTGGLGRAADAHAPNIDGGNADGSQRVLVRDHDIYIYIHI